LVLSEFVVTEFKQFESVEASFGVDVPWAVKCLEGNLDHVPALDEGFRFDPDTVRAILFGFSHNRRVYVHGPHGSGKSTHIEQVAARLNWPCVRVNLDGQITRSDLIGRDVITLKEGRQVTEFMPGILVWALQRPVVLVFDEYDAGRPDVMFVIQRLLESDGRLTLLDQNRVLTPHPGFRIFATANTAGQGDMSGLYAGTQSLNQAQMDRWHVVAELGYLAEDKEAAIVRVHVPSLDENRAYRMVAFANLCREAFRQGDLSTLVSLRTLITWAENYIVLKDLAEALRVSFVNRCDDTERSIISEMYQRCFEEELAIGGRISDVY